MEVFEGAGRAIAIIADQMDFLIEQAEALPDWVSQLKFENSSCDEAGYLPIHRVGNEAFAKLH